MAKPGNRVGSNDGQFYMPPALSPEEIKAACIQIYRLLAKRDLTNRVLDFAKQMSVMPSAVKINSTKTRWGSLVVRFANCSTKPPGCSSRKSLNFSWRLIMASSEVVDYVVVHELAHLTEMNHSPKFWAIVEGILPDYKQ